MLKGLLIFPWTLLWSLNECLIFMQTFPFHVYWWALIHTYLNFINIWFVQFVFRDLFANIYPSENMNFNAKDFVRSSFILFVTVTLCKATVHFEKKRLIEHKRVTTSPTTLQQISKIQCVAECIKEGRRGKCTFPGYNKASRTCYLGVDGTLGILDTTDAMSGVFFDESFGIKTFYCLV